MNHYDVTYSIYTVIQAISFCALVLITRLTRKHPGRDYTGFVLLAMMGIFFTGIMKEVITTQEDVYRLGQQVQELKR